MRPLDDKQRFFDMQEHPKNYSDKQLEAMMAELDKEPDTEAAWQLLMEEGKGKRVDIRWKKAAAIFIAISFLGALSVASYKVFTEKHGTPKNQTKIDTTVVETERFIYDVQDGDTIFRFENVRLDSILAIVGRHYDCQVAFKEKAPAGLRLYITCRTSQTLNEFLETLNMFDGFKVRREFYMLYVESDEKKEGKR